jgi:hypothetical protein
MSSNFVFRANAEKAVNEQTLTAEPMLIFIVPSPFKVINLDYAAQTHFCCVTAHMRQ